MNNININPTSVRTSINYNINSISVPQECLVLTKNTLSMPKSNIKPNKTRPVQSHMGTVIDSQIESAGALQYIVSKSGDYYIDYIFETANSYCGSVALSVDAGVSANITLRFLGSIHAYCNIAVKIELKANARVNFNIISNMEDSSCHILQAQVALDDGATLNTFVACKSCKYSIINYHATQTGTASTHNMYTLYKACGQSTLDLNYIIDILGRNSVTNMQLVGSLSDCATKHFKGNIDFKSGCTKSVGAESEECLCLSDNVHAIAMPIILCGEEDVDGKHATSVGKIDNKILFYLMSRGLDKQEATRLVTMAHYQKLLSRISNPALKEEISSIFIGDNKSYDQE